MNVNNLVDILSSAQLGNANSNRVFYDFIYYAVLKVLTGNCSSLKTVEFWQLIN